MKRFLISSSGSVGPPSPFWPDRAGRQVTLLERDARFRSGGGRARPSGRRDREDGLLDEAAATDEHKAHVCRSADGSELWCSEAMTYTAGHPASADIEIVLAQELRRHDDYRQAFAAYEGRMRPFVDRNPAIGPLARDMDPVEDALQALLLAKLTEGKDAIDPDAHWVQQGVLIRLDPASASIWFYVTRQKR